MSETNSLRQIARRFLADRCTTDGALSIPAGDLESLLGEIARSDLNWISIELELPPVGRRILMFSGTTHEVHVGCLRGNRWYDDQDHYPDGTAVEVEGVTHWMRFPRKPLANA